jgi:hypothetical protein
MGMKTSAVSINKFEKSVVAGLIGLSPKRLGDTEKPGLELLEFP